MRNLLKSIVSSSEKAACLARACRNEKDLFQLLVEEKTGDHKNANFAHDFKTLADVLIQETVRHDLGKKYPGLAEHIFGEESNEFRNTLGEQIQVRVCGCEKETRELLSRVLDGRDSAAQLLAKEVHSQPHHIADDQLAGLDLIPDVQFDEGNLGIWIDPIDGTSNYIQGSHELHQDTDYSQTFCRSGLGVVTVLIGVFDRTTGQAVAGVVNQPFVKYDYQRRGWSGRVHWGLVMPDGRRFSSVSGSPEEEEVGGAGRKPIAVVSDSEEAATIEDLVSRGWQVEKASAAGYKILCVILGLADAYVTMKPCTYKWDSCAGHAILRSLDHGQGGCVQAKDTSQELLYNQPIAGAKGIGIWCNASGVLAFRRRQWLSQCGLSSA